MRELGFSEHWPKLLQGEFTTWRFRRHDKDWQISEQVRVVDRPRSKDRKFLFYGDIVGKERRRFKDGITLEEARADGFESEEAMLGWFRSVHGERVDKEPINKLTIRRTRLIV